MTEFLKKSFTVSQRGTADPAKCEHGWIGKNGCCVFCGASKAEVRAYHEREAKS